MSEERIPDQNDGDMTYHYKYTRGAGNHRDVVGGGISGEASNQSRTEEPPRYAHYQVQQPMEESYADDRRQAGASGREEFRSRLGSTVALAVIFGLVAGCVFQAVNAVSGRFSHTSETPQTMSTPIGMTQTVTEGEEEDDTSVADTVSQNGTVAGVAQAAMPSVVAITSVSIQEFQSFFGYGMEYPSTGSGSGIIVGENDDELLIATNNHVVEDATTLSVCFIGSDVVSAERAAQSYVSGDGDLNIKDAVTAKIKGTDPDNDLAVISVQKSDIPEDTMNQIKIAQLGSSDDLVVGEQVVAIGNALGYGQTLTAGYVSALDRAVTLGSGTTAELIQTDAAINPGNSGGALLNMKGELIGINCAKIASNTVEGTGYAIPISKAQPILEKLMSRRTRDKVEESKIGYLGVKTADLSNEAIQMYQMPSGAFVVEVIAGQAADDAGIQKNDIITELDGQKISGRSDLNDRLQYYEAGEEIEIVVARVDDGEYKEKTITVTLGKRK